MTFKKFQKIKTEDPVITKIQNNIEETLTPVVANSSLDSQVITGINLVFGKVNIIPHRLGRILSGWRIMPHGQTRVWDSQTDNPSPNLFLYLNVATTCVADLEVW